MFHECFFKGRELYIVLPHFSNDTGLDYFVNFMGGEKYVCTDTERRSLRRLDGPRSKASTGCLYWRGKHCCLLHCALSCFKNKQQPAEIKPFGPINLAWYIIIYFCSRWRQLSLPSRNRIQSNCVAMCFGKTRECFWGGFVKTGWKKKTQGNQCGIRYYCCNWPNDCDKIVADKLCNKLGTTVLSWCWIGSQVKQ